MTTLCVIARPEPVTGTPAQILRRLRSLGYSVRYQEASA